MATSVDVNGVSQPEVLELESVCFNCFESGVTRLLITHIPFFREVVISSFSCPHCGFENRLLDPAATIQNEGQKIELKIERVNDLNRRIVRPGGSTVSIPELDASFPSSDGDLSTIEGVLVTIMERIAALQPERKIAQPDVALKLDEFSDRMRELMLVKEPFTFILDDPSGNGCIENFLAPADDPQLKVTQYKRTNEQNIALGFGAPAEENGGPPANGNSLEPLEEVANEEADPNVTKDEVLNFKVNCPNCNAFSDVRMKVVAIPHFKEVVIMASVCPSCGHKDSEVKSGGGVAPKGRIHLLKLTHPSDLSRDILVSETAAIRIPELELESLGGTLGGRFTTLEGFLVAVKEQLIKANPFVVGDSASKEEREGRLGGTIEKLNQIATGNLLGVTFELKDPAGNSYLQNTYAPDDDPNMQVIDYDRSEEENERLGLLDMKTTDYESVETSEHPSS